MLLKKSVLFLLCCSMASLSGCQITGRAKYEEGPVLVEVEGSAGDGANLIDELLAPISYALASAGVISESDWDSFDPDSFYIEVEGQNSQTVASRAKVSLSDGNYLLATRNFSVTRSGNRFYLADSNSFKQWASAYKDSADKIAIELNRETTYFGQGSSKTTVVYDNNVIAVATEYHICTDEAGENQFICTKS
ncbi:hypothetical protein KUC3_34890 [Alteromonas sp. KC3]|uniref:hypothetical protein n=1 Tax=unclassified Alteromonas TaxID=2614992 RepID=UPI001922E7CF|nr:MULTISPECIES: hypothetical protein [unclassified Alteromonas]BCO20632.1 hypothetical protein KUC3_34890 [Alteromonas sp. KC3]BCO24601.1 hypothetical protein KUC14_34700 [Alteromonas sp. KC14]